MIHTKNGRWGKSATKQVQKIQTELRSKFGSLEDAEEKVEQWIKQNPLLGIAIAATVGVALGLLLKRK